MSAFQYYRDTYTDEAAQYHIDSAIQRIDSARRSAVVALMGLAVIIDNELTLSDADRDNVAIDFVEALDAVDSTIALHIDGEALRTINTLKEIRKAMK